MFCPKCNVEFKEGILNCIDCNNILVENLPKDPEPIYVEYEVLFSTFNVGNIATIKSILDGANIKYYIHGENFIHARPLVDQARVMVAKEQIKEAVDLFQNLNVSFSG